MRGLRGAALPQGGQRVLVVLTPLTGPHACLSQPNIINKLLIAAQLQYSASPRAALCLHTSAPHRSALSGDEPGVMAVAVPQRHAPEPQTPTPPPRHGMVCRCIRQSGGPTRHQIAAHQSCNPEQASHAIVFIHII